MVKVRAAST